MKINLTTLLCMATLAGAAHAAPLTFDFKDPKGVNSAAFKLDAPLESISGSANDITGSVTFDPANPGATQGKIVVGTASLHVPNPMMKGHLQGEQWMDVAKYPQLQFEAKKLAQIKTEGDKTTAIAQGTMTVKGVSKEVEVPVTLTYLKDKLGMRVPNMKGDLLVIRTEFVIKRSDYGINPKVPADKVADDIHINLAIAGAAPQ
jgi:polyisoprenoid-binding protein YceI